LASLVSKNLLPDVVVPIGIITTMVGIPFFVSIIVRRRVA
jgi:iron complex transport system permease protein